MRSSKTIPKQFTMDVEYSFFQSGQKVTISEKVLIYEDQPKQLTRATADQLFKDYPDVKEIHELNDKWGGRWTRSQSKS